MKKAVIFIDGSILHNQLKGIGLQERDIYWQELFQSITPEDCQLVRAYWYQVDRVAPVKWYPNQFVRYCPHDLDPEQFELQCKSWYDDECRRIRDMHDFLYNAICLNNDLIEFRYVGYLKVNPYRMERLGESGLDIGLVVDLVTMSAHYDTAILLSGDPGYAPAIQFIKNQLKQVHFVMIHKGDPDAGDRGGARNLRVIADTVDLLFEAEIKDPENGFLLNSQRNFSE